MQKDKFFDFKPFDNIEYQLRRIQDLNGIEQTATDREIYSEMRRAYTMYEKCNNLYKQGLALGLYRICGAATFCLSWLSFHHENIVDPKLKYTLNAIEVINIFSIILPISMLVYDDYVMYSKRRLEKKALKATKVITIVIYLFILASTYV